MSLILSLVLKLKPGSDAKHFVVLQHVHRGHVTKMDDIRINFVSRYKVGLVAIIV